MIWCPRQIPNTGTLPSSSPTLARAAGDLVARQEAVEIVGCPPARRPAREIADDHAATMRRRRFVVAFVDAVVADVRIGERDDLSGVGRVGEDLLIARERGVEDDLAGRDTFLRREPDRHALERLAVGQYQQRLR